MMDDSAESSIDQSSQPRWKNIVESPLFDQPSTQYKLKLKYGGYFRLAKNSCRRTYCYEYQKSIYIDTYSYYLGDLVEFVKNLHPSKRDLVFLILFVDKNAIEQSFIELESDEAFKVMLDMYEKGKEVTIYVTPRNTLDTGEIQQKVKTMTEEHTCIKAARVSDDFKEELRNRNPESVVDIGFEIDGDKKRFQRFFISLVACSMGFLAGYRP
nr:transposase, MuDR, MULE transposase domain protein [Tanacetum cinerariifolium]